MNWMKKLAALLLAMLLCLPCALAEEEEDDDTPMSLPDACVQSLFGDDEGEWQAEMLWYNTGLLFLSVEHRTSENEADIWSVTIDGAW